MTITVWRCGNRRQAGCWRQHCVASRLGECASRGDGRGNYVDAANGELVLSNFRGRDGLRFELRPSSRRSAYSAVEASDATLRESEERFRIRGGCRAGPYLDVGLEQHVFQQALARVYGRSLERELGNGWVRVCIRVILKRCPRTQAFDARNRSLCNTGSDEMTASIAGFQTRECRATTRNGMFAGYIGSCVDVTELR